MIFKILASEEAKRNELNIGEHTGEQIKKLEDLRFGTEHTAYNYIQRRFGFMNSRFKIISEDGEIKGEHYKITGQKVCVCGVLNCNLEQYIKQKKRSVKKNDINKRV